MQKITCRMSYKTLLNLPDSREKFLALEKKLLKLQYHGAEFEQARQEWRRLFPIYRNSENK